MSKILFRTVLTYEDDLISNREMPIFFDTDGRHYLVYTGKASDGKGSHINALPLLYTYDDADKGDAPVRVLSSCQRQNIYYGVPEYDVKISEQSWEEYKRIQSKDPAVSIYLLTERVTKLENRVETFFEKLENRLDVLVNSQQSTNTDVETE